MSGICDTFSCSITGDVLTFNPDAIPKPNTLQICMTRGEHRIAEELRKQFGGFEHVIIDVDGLQYKFNADGFIGLLESYEGAPGTRWHDLFGTPERAARTLYVSTFECRCCVIRDECGYNLDKCVMNDRDALLEWLKGEHCVHHG